MSFGLMGSRRNRSNEKSFQKFTWHASAAALCRAFAWLSGRFHIGVPYEFLDMSRLYVRVMTGFYSHRKTAKLRSFFGNDAFWIPPRLWAYAAEHQPDGNMADYTSEVLADVLGCSKYANTMLVALKKCGFVDESGMIHDWNQHNGYHEKYADRAKKAAAARWSKEKSPTPPKEEIGKRKEERGDKHCLTDACSIKSLSAPVIPLLLQTPAFQEAWGRWNDHLRQKRKPATYHALDLQLKKLEGWGEKRAIAAINNSIMGNWQGIFEEKTNGFQKPRLVPGDDDKF